MDVPPIAVPQINEQVRRKIGSAAEPTDFGSVQWAVSSGNPDGAEQTLGLATFDGGKGNVEHVHPNCEEIVFVLDGEVEHTLGEQSARLSAGDLIVVPRGVPHRLFNHGPNAARALVVFSSPDRKFEPTGR
jgi:quercetin dioxygenase-like cupin family protein